MSQADKALAKILGGQSDRNVTFEELERALLHVGWALDRVVGSHHIYRSTSGRIMTIPRHGKDVKPCYVRLARQTLNNP